MINETKYVHPCGTYFISPKNILLKFVPVVGTMCAVWVHILCFTVQFWEVQIWFFITAKYQLRKLEMQKYGGG